MSPVATVAETTMQENHRCSGAVGGVPDSGAFVLDIPLARARRAEAVGLLFRI
jgi:hypothetical protein